MNQNDIAMQTPLMGGVQAAVGSRYRQIKDNTDTRRLEASSNGVVSIIITIMVLEMKVPHGADFAASYPLWLVFLSYILSFVYTGIYWNKHHHLLYAAKRVNASIM